MFESLLDASDRVEAFEEWNSKRALAEEFEGLVAVERMVEAGAHVAEQALQRQPLEIRGAAHRAQRQVHHRTEFSIAIMRAATALRDQLAGSSASTSAAAFHIAARAPSISMSISPTLL